MSEEKNTLIEVQQETSENYAPFVHPLVKEDVEQGNLTSQDVTIPSRKGKLQKELARLEKSDLDENQKAQLKQFMIQQQNMKLEKAEYEKERKVKQLKKREKRNKKQKQSRKINRK